MHGLHICATMIPLKSLREWSRAQKKNKKKRTVDDSTFDELGIFYVVVVLSTLVVVSHLNEDNLMTNSLYVFITKSVT